MMTFDQTYYEGQKAGEFTLVKNPTDGFEIQTRFIDVSGGEVWSKATAVAMQLTGLRIGLYVKDTGIVQILVDGLIINLENNTTTNPGNGVTISRDSDGWVTIGSNTGYLISCSYAGYRPERSL